MALRSNEGYWNWAEFSHREIVEGRARGNRRSLWLRARIQSFLFKLGNFAQKHCVTVLLIGLVLCVLCALGLYKVKLETNPETLWMEVGGRLEEEQAYTKEFGPDLVSMELIIQTPNEAGSNILTIPALQKHVQLVQIAMEIEVEVFDQTWAISDLCVKPSVPEFGISVVNKALEKLLPCTVITPLDCFWDGAKIYTQNISALNHKIHWTKFDPKDFLTRKIPKRFGNGLFHSDKMDALLEQGGISHGYMNRPCLDPAEKDCPKTAPNKASMKKPNIGEVLTGGCTGLAEKLMIWSEDLIIGGTQKSKNGTITRAAALQTVINLMSDKNMHKFWIDNNGFAKAKVQHIDDWSTEKARTVLETWQRKFVKIMNGLSKESDKQNVFAFSLTSFTDILKKVSEPDVALIAGGYVLMLAYACFTMIRWNSIVQSQGCMGVLGVLLICLSVTAGLGLSSALGIPFNAASTQVLPFLALGLGVDDMFLLSHTFRDMSGRSVGSEEHAGYCLSTTGVSIMLTSCTNAIAFFMAAIIPIPALRALCLKAGIIVIFNFLAVITIYPAMIALDIRRRQSQRYDIFCCVQKDSHTRVTQIRPESSYGSSMVTINRSSDEDSSLHQISVANANVSLGTSSGDAFTLPGVALKASANCNFNETICNGMLGGNIMSLPGMGNIVVSVSSEHHREGETSSQNANANVTANVSNNGKGSSLNINASSVADCVRSSAKEDGKRVQGATSKVNYGCFEGSRGNVLPTNQRKSREFSQPRFNHDDDIKNKNNSGRKKESFRSSVNISQNMGENSDSQAGNVQVSANAAVENNQIGEPSCSSNAEVILRPERVTCSRRRRNSSSQLNNFSTNMSKTFASLSIGHLTKKYYAPLLQKTPAKVVVLLLSAVIFAVTMFGCFHVKDGMDMNDVIPKGTKLSEFLEKRNKYFPFYPIVIVTKGNFNYPNGQEKLYMFHKAFAKVDNIVKSADNKLQRFWLINFREWLKGLQKRFDKEWESGAITSSGASKNASSQGKLAYRLLRHTGNEADQEQVRTERLVNKDGIIHRRGFYHFLRAWYHNDPLGYEISQVHLKPVPEFWKDDKDKLYIHPAKPIKYAEIPLYINNLKETADYIKAIKQIRAICDKFADDGLPNYPRGTPFTFWEQYIWLRKQLLVTVIIVLAASFLVISAVLVNVWAGAIVAIVLASTTIELFGFLGLAGIKLSAIPAVTLIFSIGVGVEFTVHLCMVFVTSVGDRNQRLQHALETVLSPVVDGAISTILSIIMLSGSEFDFVFKYFFLVLTALIIVGFFNGVVLLPVVLSLIGPNPEVVPLREFSTGGSTRSWLGLMPFNSNAASSVSNLTFDAQQAAAQESSTETDDVHLQIMPNAESQQAHDLRTRKFRRTVVPKHLYGKNNASRTESPKQVTFNPAERTQSGSVVRNAQSVAKVTATATVTVELQHEDPKVSQKSHAIVTRPPNPQGDLEVVDLEEEFV